MIRMVMEIIRMPMTMTKPMVTMKKRPTVVQLAPPDDDEEEAQLAPSGTPADVAKSQDP